MKPPFKKSLDGLKKIRSQRTQFFSREESKKLKIPKLKQIANLPRTLTTWERILIFVLAGIIIVSLIFWIQIYYLKHSELVPKVGGQYTEGMVGQPKYINPALAQTNDIDLDLSSLIFSGLVKYDQNQELALDLALEYEISEDKKTYRFTLKPNLFWQDGEPLATDDIIFTVHRIQDPDFKSPLRSVFLGVEMEQIDERTLKFVLKEPYSPFLSNLNFGILPMHIWETIPSANAALAEYNLKPIGSGPWQFHKLKKDKEGNIESYSLKPNPHYYGKTPFLEKISFQFYPDFESLLSDLKARQVDGLSYIPKEEKDKLNGDEYLEIYSLELPHTYSIFLNQNQNKLLENKYIRQALEYATPKTEILEQAIFGNGKIIYSPLLLSNNDELAKREFDPAKAEELLEAQEWTKDEEDGIYTRAAERLSFTLVTTDWPEYLKTAKILKAKYKQAGVELVTESYNTAKIQQEYIRPRNFEALLYGEILVHNPDPYIFWYSSQTKDPGLNIACFENQEADRILEEIRTLNPEEREEKYKALEKIISQETPVIPLYTPHYLYGVNKKIKGIKAQEVVFPHERFTGLSDWYIEQERKWVNKED